MRRKFLRHNNSRLPNILPAYKDCELPRDVPRNKPNLFIHCIDSIIHSIDIIDSKIHFSQPALPLVEDNALEVIFLNPYPDSRAMGGHKSGLQVKSLLLTSKVYYLWLEVI